MKTVKNNEINVGVDTGKAQLDIFVRPMGDYFTVPNNSTGIREAVHKLRKYSPTRVVIEATGRLEQAFVLACVEHDLPIVVMNPVVVRVVVLSSCHLSPPTLLSGGVCIIGLGPERI